jgi:glycosyltransferase involved in cell wall biosynthesis
VKLSVIIPAHNAQQWIADALTSCLRQRYRSFEIVLIDDGSTDETYPIVSRLVEGSTTPVQVIRTTNKGASAARNVGLSTAKGDYVLFLDADDVLADDALEILSSMALQTNADAVFGAHCDLYQDSGRTERARRRLVYSDSYANIARFLWPTGAALLRKSGPNWNENRVVWEVMEYFLDFLGPGRQAVFTDAVVMTVRQHDSPTRITRRHPHYDPAITGFFFAEQKDKLVKSGRLSFERASALDYHILGNAYRLLRRERTVEADRLYGKISWDKVRGYDWCRFSSLAWLALYGGQKLGMRGFQNLGMRSFNYLNKIWVKA